MSPRPRDDKGHFIPLDCPRWQCGCGKLRHEGRGYWKCDGLADPEDVNKPLVECSFSHFDGDPYTPPSPGPDTTGPRE